MTRQQNITWTVQPSDLVCSPLGYKVELGETAKVTPALASHSTFDGFGEFEYLNGGVWSPYPVNGLLGASAGTQVRMLRQGETPTSALILGNDSVVVKMSLDCKNILAYRQVCETDLFWVDSVSCNADGQIWVKDTGGVITVMDRWLNVVNTLRLDSDCLLAVIDPFRNILWEVFDDSVMLIRTSDMSTVFTASIPATTAVLAWDFSRPSGTLFLALDGSPSFAVAVSIDGTVTQFAPYATGICQWGAVGAIACMPYSATLCVFNGTTTVETIPASNIWLSSATKVASQGNGYFLATDGSSSVVKVNESFYICWSMATPLYWSNIDLKTTPGPSETGRVTFLTSPLGVASYRDMASKSWMYGKTEMPILTSRTSGNVIAAVIPELRSAHVAAKITGFTFVENEKSENSSISSVENESSETSSISSEWLIIAIAAGDGAHSLGLKSDGTVVATGDNSAHQCDVSGWTGITAISAGGYHSLGLKINETVVAAGDNSEHQCDVSGWTGIT